MNAHHNWYRSQEEEVTYVMMEMRQETDYVKHHIQKIAGFFAAMRNFAKELRNGGYSVEYLKIDDRENRQSLEENLRQIIEKTGADKFEYQLPDKYRLDQQLTAFATAIDVDSEVIDTEHFFTSRSELDEFFGEKNLVMENFYRYMRKKHDLLMEGDEPAGGRWNYDTENRNRIPKGHEVIEPLLFKNDVSGIVSAINDNGVEYFGEIDSKRFPTVENRRSKTDSRMMSRGPVAHSRVASARRMVLPPVSAKIRGLHTSGSSQPGPW